MHLWLTTSQLAIVLSSTSNQQQQRTMDMNGQDTSVGKKDIPIKGTQCGWM